jgi:hypothetical protein
VNTSYQLALEHRTQVEEFRRRHRTGLVALAAPLGMSVPGIGHRERV